MGVNRRTFIKKASLGFSAPWIIPPIELVNPFSNKDTLDIHIFSKHLHFLNIRDAAEKAVALGFKGLDLTVRPKGHVLPENAVEELPKAIEAIKAAGSTCTLMTTAIRDHTNVHDSNIIKTAAEQGVQFYRCDWFKYKKDKSMPESIAYFQKQINALGELNQKHSIVGCYQNHAGKKIGASYWEIKQLLETVNPAFFGAQYDIAGAGCGAA